MNHLDPAGFNVHAAITCILPMAQVVYTSDEDGRVVSALCADVMQYFTDSDGSMNGTAYNEQHNGVRGILPMHLFGHLLGVENASCAMLQRSKEHSGGTQWN